MLFGYDSDAVCIVALAALLLVSVGMNLLQAAHHQREKRSDELAREAQRQTILGLENRLELQEMKTKALQEGKPDSADKEGQLEVSSPVPLRQVK